MQCFNKRRALQGAFVLTVLFSGVTLFWYMDGFAFMQSTPPVPRLDMPALPVEQTVAKKPPVAAPKNEDPQSRTEKKEPLSAPMQSDMATLQNLSAKQAALEEVKLDVAIAEQVAKLKELREGKPAPVVTVPQATPVLPPLPPLSIMPAVQSSAEQSPVPVSSLPPIRRTSGLVAIQGIDGTLSAVFSTANGKQTVRVGDTFMGSKIRSITLDGVTLTSGKTVTIGD